MRRYPGESNQRQAVQTVYGGAHLFRVDTVKKLGEAALGALQEHAPNPKALAGALGINIADQLADKLYDRIVDKLKREPVEDFRLDFEDGYGNRPDDEEDGHGCLLTHSPDTYKIPAVGDAPVVFNVAFLSNATQPNVIHGSKAIGEPPLMLAISVREAIRDAIAAFGPPGGEVSLASPATCEAISNAIAARVSQTKLPEKTEHATAEQVLS